MASGKNTLGSRSKGLVSLMWNEYDSFIINGFSTLYQNDDLADVTLICEGRSFKAHRVILSVWSSYFREIFISNPAPHPIVILRQTSSEDFELILRFMYQGKILVPQDDADRFLKTAENFKIAGLCKMKIQAEIALSQEAEFVSSRNLAEVVDPLTTFINMTPNCQNIINLKNSPVSTSMGPYVETTEVTTNSVVSHSSPKSSQMSRTSVSITPSESSYVDELTSTKNCVGGSLPVKPFPIFQRHHQKMQPSPGQHQSMIGSTTIRQIENYADKKKTQNCNSPSDVITFDTSKMKVEAKQAQQPVVESVMVLQNFIQTSADVQTLVDPSRDDQAVSESIFNSIYNPMSGGPKQKMIQIQNQSDGSIIGYTFIPDDQSGLGMEEQHQNLLESPMSSSSHSQSENQCPEVIDLDVDDSEHSPESILPMADTGTNTLPVTTFSVTNTNTKPTPRRRSKKRKGDNDEVSEGEPEDKDVDERVACPTCAKIVKKTSLKVHMKRSHLEEGVVLLCPICGKQVSSKGVYYKHMYMHRRKSEFPSEDDRMDEFDDM